LCGLAVALYVPGVRDLFRFSSPPLLGLLLSFAAAAIGLIWYEIYKGWLRQRSA
jgi:hypothetical protein